MEREYIRPITAISEFNELIFIQKDVWGISDIDIFPVHTFRVVTDFMKPNGVVLGYFIEDKICGYLLAFPTSNPKVAFGGMLGISRNYQKQGIGYKLNVALREYMLIHGVEKIIWTYDPLESVNANLYLAKLGGIVTQHLIDYYGDVKSKLHSGLPTDRFKVEWNIKERRVAKRIEKDCKENYDYGAADAKRVEIPLDMQDIRNRDMKEALKWRKKTREFFDEYINKQQLIGVDFVRDPAKNKGVYLFKKRPG